MCQSKRKKKQIFVFFVALLKVILVSSTSLNFLLFNNRLVFGTLANDFVQR